MKMGWEKSKLLKNKDLSLMTRRELTEEIIRLRRKIRSIKDTRGDDRCWKDYEELFNLLPEGYTPPERDETVELELCQQFIRGCHDPNVKYVSPQRRIEELESENEELREQITALKYKVGGYD